MAAQSLIGNLAVLLSMDTAAFEKGSSHASKILKKTQRDFAALGSKMQNIGAAMSVGITTPLLGFGALAVKEAQEASQAMAQVNAALASMGPVAGRTAEQLKSAADALEMSSLYEGDEILRKVTANLLTFGNISGKAFDQAQQAAVNLATRLNMDLQSAAILVGKALNDPVKGMAALGRAGIQFSVEQKEAIKALVETGNTAGAQAILLGEFQKQFGGAAQAAQNTDPLNKASDAFKQMAEQVGTALLPIIPVFTDAVVKVANAFSNLSPETQKFIIIAGGIAAALGPVLMGLGVLVSTFGALLPIIMKIGPAFVVLKGIMIGLAPVLVAVKAGLLAIMANPFVLGAAAVIGGIYLAWKHWDKIAPIVQRMVAAVREALIGQLNKVWDSLKAKIDAVKGWFFNLYDAVVGHSYIPDMVEGIRKEMARLDAVMVQPAAAASKKAGEAFKELQTRVHGLMGELFPQQARENQFNRDLQDLTAFAKEAKWSVEQLEEAIGKLRLARGIDEVVKMESVTGEGEVGGSPFPEEDMSRAIDWAEQWKMKLAEVADRGLESISAGLADVITGTAKLGDVFKSTIKGMIADLLQFQIRKALVAGIEGIFGGGMSAKIGLDGARAMGGPVRGGGAYLVGERGPEIFQPSRNGYIKPNSDIGRSGITINQHFAPNFAGDAATKQDLMMMGQITKAETMAAIKESNRRR